MVQALIWTRLGRVHQQGGASSAADRTTKSYALIGQNIL